MGILTGCLSACQTDWLADYWGLVLLCGEIIITGKHNKRLMGRGCQLVCVCVCMCWFGVGGGMCKCVMASSLYQHSSFCGWVSRPSLTIILSHLSLSHTHTHTGKSKSSQHTHVHTHTHCGLGGEVVLRRSELGVRVERNKRGTDNTSVGRSVFYFQCL